jgi:16S rRNA (uracil1498-N3)-methyltransferase
MTPPATLYARGPFQPGALVILEEEEAHHLRVRRAGEGDTVRLVDGRGGIAAARVVLEGGVLGARVVSATTVAPPPPTDLLVAAGDRDRFLWLVEKATELGATRVQPVITERSQQVATRFQVGHLDKAVRRSREALKQSGGAWAPAVPAPMPLGDALRVPAPKAVRMVADPEGGALPMLGEHDVVLWAVGPEGGFTEAERAALKAAGFRPVALGRSILRYETAALAALAVTGHARLGPSSSGS